MKRNAYFAQVLKPESGKQLLVIQLMLWISQMLSMPLKVFVRKRFGERYFIFPMLCLVLLALVVFPPVITDMWSFIKHPDHSNFSVWGFLWHYTSWYVLIGLCLKQGIERWKEIKREPSVFDFGKYSLYAGDILPWFYNFKYKGKKVDIRQVETFYEPAFFFIAGSLLFLFGQYIGIFIAGVSLFLWWSNWIFYNAGDNFLMDCIDEIICNEEMAATFLDATDDENKRGFRFFGERPVDPEMRKKLLGALVDQDVAVEAR